MDHIKSLFPKSLKKDDTTILKIWVDKTLEDEDFVPSDDYQQFINKCMLLLREKVVQVIEIYDQLIESKQKDHNFRMN